MSVLEKCPYQRGVCIREVSVLERTRGVRIREVYIFESVCIRKVPVLEKYPY